jgi:hypothetical protein
LRPSAAGQCSWWLPLVLYPDNSSVGAGRSSTSPVWFGFIHTRERGLWLFLRHRGRPARASLCASARGWLWKMLHCGVVAVLLASADRPAHASAALPVHSGCGNGQAFGLTVGVYNTTICNETAWTFRSLFKGAVEILSPLGFTQTVAHLSVPPNESIKRWPPLKAVKQPVVPVNNSAENGFVGTGHGGELIFGLGLTSSADSKEYDLLRVGQGTPMPAPGVVYPPNTTLRVTKRSQIGPYLATEIVELHPTFGLNVSSTLTLAFANASYEYVDYFYATMTMFALPYKRWCAQRLNGTFAYGTFTFDMSFSLHADIRWAAVFDDDSGQGGVFQYPGGQAPIGSADGFKNSFWNRKYDHKLYLRIDAPKTFGVPLTIQHSVLGFVATNATWMDVARSLVRGWPMYR